LLNESWELLQEYEDHKFNSDMGYIRLEGFNPDTGNKKVKELPVLYRTHPKYKRKLLAKLYSLEDWYNELPAHKKYVSMVTLTTKQRGLSYFDQYDQLRTNWQKLSDLIKKQHPDAEYIAMWEPHKTGYAHIHIIYFSVRFDSSYANKLMRLWKDKYGAGGSEGVKIDTRYKRSLKSARGYVMKYVAKSLTEDGYNEVGKLDKSDLNQYHDDNTGVQFELFNAVLWKMSKHDTEYTGIRSFQPSRTLSSVMSMDIIPKSNTVWYRVVFNYGNKDYITSQKKVLEVDLMLDTPPPVRPLRPT